MARKNGDASWLNQGFSSAKIADRMGVSVETAMAYLYNQVGERRIALSDILFTIDKKSKAAEEVECEREKHCRIGGSARHFEIVTRMYISSDAWIYNN